MVPEHAVRRDQAGDLGLGGRGEGEGERVEGGGVGAVGGAVGGTML